MLRKYWCELCDVVVEGVIMVVVSVSHLEEGPVDFHHLILEGPVRVSEVPAGVLHLQFIIVVSFISSLAYICVYLHCLGLHSDSECCLARGNKQGAWPQS